MRWTVEAESWTGLPPGAAARATLLGDLEGGRLVARSRTTRTESGRLHLPGAGGLQVHRKVYRYPTARDRLRGILRTTLLAPSRARRERDVLRGFLHLGPPPLAPEPVAILECRAGGLLLEAWLLSRTVPSARPPSAGPPAPGEPEALGRCLGRLHAAGWCSLDAAPRNFLCVGSPAAVEGALKVDSGRARRAGPSSPRRAGDLATLVAGLEAGWPAPSLALLLDAYAAATGEALPAWRGRLPAARAALARRRPSG